MEQVRLTTHPGCYRTQFGCHGDGCHGDRSVKNHFQRTFHFDSIEKQRIYSSGKILPHERKKKPQKSGIRENRKAKC